MIKAGLFHAHQIKRVRILVMDGQPSFVVLPVHARLAVDAVSEMEQELLKMSDVDSGKVSFNFDGSDELSVGGKAKKGRKAERLLADQVRRIRLQDEEPVAEGANGRERSASRMVTIRTRRNKNGEYGEREKELTWRTWSSVEDGQNVWNLVRSHSNEFATDEDRVTARKHRNVGQKYYGMKLWQRNAAGKAYRPGRVFSYNDRAPIHASSYHCGNEDIDPWKVTEHVMPGGVREYEVYLDVKIDELSPDRGRAISFRETGTRFQCYRSGLETGRGKLRAKGVVPRRSTR